jgi:hypothetical protein
VVYTIASAGTTAPSPTHPCKQFLSLQMGPIHDLTKRHVYGVRVDDRGEARISAVGVLKGVLILQRKFAMVGESDPIVITNSGVCGSTPLRQYCTGARPQPDALVWGRGSVRTDVERKKLPSCGKFNFLSVIYALYVALLRKILLTYYR